MARTYRTIPVHWNRRPKFKHKLLDGVSRKHITTDWDDKPVAARREAHISRGWGERFPVGLRPLSLDYHNARRGKEVSHGR